jgi:hypothetical protein
MGRRIKLIIAIAVPWLLLAGQVVSEVGDPYLTVENGVPDPSEGRQVITMRAWGLLQSNSESLELDCDDDGLANARLSVSAGQLATSVFTLGFLRPITVSYHCHEGNVPSVPD